MDQSACASTCVDFAPQAACAGPVVSIAMVAAIGNGSAFSEGRDFGAWLGLEPDVFCHYGGSARSAALTACRYRRRLEPLTALAGAWLEGHPLKLLGAGNIRPMLPQVHTVGQAVSYVHTILGNIIIWAAGLHAVSALFHHLVLRDNVLTSMLPDWRRSPASADNISQKPA
jgi:hypothetical protein